MIFMKWYIWKLARPGQTLLCRALSHSDLSQVSAERQNCCKACHSCVSELCKDQTDLSLVSKTLCQVIVLGSMSKKANFLQGDFHKNKNTRKTINMIRWMAQSERYRPDFICSQCVRISLVNSKFDKSSHLTWHCKPRSLLQPLNFMCSRTDPFAQIGSPELDWTSGFPSL